ncbi:hypothetical protein B5X24_HaOG214603 [Helicoverpa armigera]|uniref:Aconitase A/isopropylmalate dehydratase small subunit swivel domain-containing protein n=1 Tax=Helicoverpa armigera TaxID=29058 RepID=A0A2W1B2I6_HELAM|nr:hypothetical protein B5X24_HaOG214603 [Helicoverpa armigera]
MDIFDAAHRYATEGVPLIAIVGKDYGSGSSRDWAAKGPYLLGIRAVIAESFERIHRANLVGMGIIPLQFLPGQSADSFALDGSEQYSVHVPENIAPGDLLTVQCIVCNNIARASPVGMGIIPLQFLPGQSADSFALDGCEQYSVHVPENIAPGDLLTVQVSNGQTFQVKVRFDTEVDLTYFKNGGILNYMIRKML